MPIFRMDIYSLALRNGLLAVWLHMTAFPIPVERMTAVKVSLLKKLPRILVTLVVRGSQLRNLKYSEGQLYGR